MGFKIWKFLGKPLGYMVGFFVGEGANGVDQAASFPDVRGAVREDIKLDFRKLLNVFGVEAPFGLGVFSPDADSGAWGIDEDAVEFAGVLGESRTGVSEIVNLGASGSAF